MFRVIGGMCILALVLGNSPIAQSAKIDPKADQLLKKMSDFLAAQEQFSFNANSENQLVTKNLQKLEMDASSDISVQRPNRLRSDRRGEVAKDMSLYYDGKTITLFGRRVDYYATNTAPAKLDQAIDFAREKLGLEAPGADLLYGNPYQALMESVVSGMYVGRTQIDGAPVHHLAFRGQETDWQIWIEDSDRPLPRKYVITSKKVKGSPEFSVTLRDWNLNPTFTSDHFTFTPPKDATRIQFAGATPSKSKRKG